MEASSRRTIQLVLLATRYVDNNVQVAPYAIRAPAQVVLEVLARRARALRHNVKG